MNPDVSQGAGHTQQTDERWDIGVIFNYVTSSAPSPSLLGTTNGVSQTCTSFVRALGPVGATTLFSLSAEHKNILHGYAVFVFIGFLITAAVYSATLLPESEWPRAKDEDEDDDN